VKRLQSSTYRSDVLIYFWLIDRPYDMNNVCCNKTSVLKIFIGCQTRNYVLSYYITLMEAKLYIHIILNKPSVTVYYIHNNVVRFTQLNLIFNLSIVNDRKCFFCILCNRIDIALLLYIDFYSI